MSTVPTAQTSPIGKAQGVAGSASPVAVPETAPQTDKKPRENRDPLAPFHRKIHELILKPKLDELVKKHPGKSDSELHEQFRKDTGSCVALKRFREWMAECGFVQAWISR